MSGYYPDDLSQAAFDRAQDTLGPEPELCYDCEQPCEYFIERRCRACWLQLVKLHAKRFGSTGDDYDDIQCEDLGPDPAEDYERWDDETPPERGIQWGPGGG